jgi:hypothetical protein
MILEVLSRVPCFGPVITVLLNTDIWIILEGTLVPGLPRKLRHFPITGITACT